MTRSLLVKPSAWFLSNARSRPHVIFAICHQGDRNFSRFSHARLKPQVVDLEKRGKLTKKRETAGAFAFCLEQELSRSFSKQTLKDDNQYFCDNCRQHVDADQCTTLHSLPPYLHIVVTRSYWDAEAGTQNKVCDPIVYPAILDISRFMDSSSVDEVHRSTIELIAVLEH